MYTCLRRAASNPVVNILSELFNHTILESLILIWLEQKLTIQVDARGSIIRTCLSLQDVARIVPSCFQLNDCITSV